MKNIQVHLRHSGNDAWVRHIRKLNHGCENEAYLLSEKRYKNSSQLLSRKIKKIT